MKKYVILPSNTDLNRGDQALVWQTIDVAKKSGFTGDYYMLAGNKKLTTQSQSQGINILTPLLKHPGRKFKKKDNNEYSPSLIIKWGLVALFDFILSILLLFKFTRIITYPFLSKENKETLNILSKSEACFVKGGGFIHSAGKLTDSYTVYFQLFHIMFAQSLGKPIYIMPNSFGPFKGIGVSYLVKKVLSKCELVTVRESISKEMLSEIGVTSQLFPDLGFGLEKSNRKNQEVKLLNDRFPDYKLVAITARPYRFPGSSNPVKNYKDYVEGLIVFSKWLYKKKFLPVFVEQTLSESTHENDMTCISEVISELTPNEYGVISNHDFNCRDLKSIYSEFDYVVGTRFHSVIFSLSEGVPSVAITYGGNKGQGIMRDIGLSEYAISIRDLNAEELIAVFTNLRNNREEVSSAIKQQNTIIEKNLTDLVGLIERIKKTGKYK